jgi:hypothetical protein
MKINAFEQYLAWANLRSCSLPYQFGGATQCGRLNDHNNNQDAVAVVSRDELVVGVVCDGCSSSSLGYSNSEVGARLLGVLTAEIVVQAIESTSVARFGEVLPGIERAVFERLADMLKILTGSDDQDKAINTLWLATVVGFAVDRTDFVVFGCGDGLYAVDDQVTTLSGFEGRYLAARLLSGHDWSNRLANEDGAFSVHRTGKVASLRGLLIGTDGFEDLTDRFPDLVAKFVQDPGDSAAEAGFCSGLGSDFRRRVWQTDEVSRWAATQDRHDDRSFLLLRRLDDDSAAATQESPSGTHRDGGN